MTKNEIVARWMGYLVGPLSGWLSGTSQIEYSYLKVDGEIINPVRLDKLKYDSSYDWFMTAWVKFRDLKFEELTEDFYVHGEFSHEIGAAIIYSTITEAFDELVKGIEWYNSLKK